MSPHFVRYLLKVIKYFPQGYNIKTLEGLELKSMSPPNAPVEPNGSSS